MSDNEMMENFEDDATVEVIVEKPVKVKKPRKELSTEAKANLLERLAKGRQKAQERRELKSKAKNILEVKSEDDSKKLVALTKKPLNKKVKIIDEPYIPYKNSNEYKYMKKQIDDIKDYMTKSQLKAIKEVPVTPIEKSPLKQETAVKAPVKVEPKPPQQPQQPGYSTIRNKRRKPRAGF